MATDSDSASTIPSPVATGDVLAQKYEIVRVLGAGGMGVVVEAKDKDLDRRVAVKFLLPRGASSPTIVARFMREARAAVKITSEHVAKVIEVGRLEDGAPYIVMEFLEGMDLAQVVAKGPLPIDSALDYVLQATEAIAEAHAKGIVHRDLKPANLFLSTRADGSPIVKVLDFGISAVADPAAAEHALTATGAVMGSPFYMAPEQAKSARSANSQSDIWSLGAVLHELIAGKPPFGGETMAELIAAIMTEPAPALRALRPDVPEGLEAVVLRCLSKEPDERYASVGELAQALAPFAPERARLSVSRAAAVSAASSRRPPALDTDAPVGPSGTVLMPDSVPAKAEGADTAAAWTDTQVPATPQRGWVRGAAIAAGATTLLALGFAISKLGSAPEAAPSAAGPADSVLASAATPPPPTPSSAETPSEAPAASASAIPAPSASTASPAAPRPKPAAVGATPAGKPAAKPPASATGKPPSLAMPLQ